MYLYRFLILFPIVIAIVCSLGPSTYIYAHLSGDQIQQWIDRENGIKIQFRYEPYKPEIHNYNELNFSIQDLHTGKHLKNLIASLTIPDSEPTYKFDNITVTDVDFGVVCPFLDEGKHQVVVSSQYPI